MIFLIFLSFALIFLPPCVYSIVSWKKKDFRLFDPLCFPCIFLLIYYGIPCLILPFVFEQDIYPNALYIQIAGTISYLVGVSLYKLRKYNGKDRVNKSCNTIHPVIMESFWVIGISLLFLYGYWSGVTVELLAREDVEDLRRATEIGKGIVKVPGIFFTTFSTLWLFGTSISKRKRICVSNVLLLLFPMALIFFTTGNKAPAFWILLLAIGIYNKFKSISPAKVLVVGFLIVFLIGLIDTFRGGETIDSFNAILRKGTLRYSAVYVANYVPVIEQVDQGLISPQYGKEYIQNAAAIIPRFLWPTKPLVFGYFLKDQLGRTFRGGGLPATPFGSLYLNFSYFGVIFGMILIGYVYSLIYQTYRTEMTLGKIIICLFLLTYLTNPALLLYQVLVLTVFATFIFLINRFLPSTLRRI